MVQTILQLNHDASIFQASENRNESSSSQEGEIYCAIGTEQKKEQQQTGSPAWQFHHLFPRVNKPKTPNLTTRKGGKLKV